MESEEERGQAAAVPDVKAEHEDGSDQQRDGRGSETDLSGGGGPAASDDAQLAIPAGRSAANQHADEGDGSAGAAPPAQGGAEATRDAPMARTADCAGEGGELEGGELEGASAPAYDLALLAGEGALALALEGKAEPYPPLPETDQERDEFEQLFQQALREAHGAAAGAEGPQVGGQGGGATGEEAQVLGVSGVGG